MPLSLIRLVHIDRTRPLPSPSTLHTEFAPGNPGQWSTSTEYSRCHHLIGPLNAAGALHRQQGPVRAAPRRGGLPGTN
eukprot:8603745-Pyramimonas_sp.AAC.1